MRSPLVFALIGALAIPVAAQQAPDGGSDATVPAKRLDDGEHAISVSSAAFTARANKPPPPAPPPRTYTPHEVFKTQKHLRKTGYLKTRPSSRWTPNSIKALKKWQSAQGMNPTGQMDERIWSFVTLE